MTYNWGLSMKPKLLIVLGLPALLVTLTVGKLALLRWRSATHQLEPEGNSTLHRTTRNRWACCGSSTWTTSRAN